MSKYTKIVFTDIPEKYEPLLDLLEDVCVGIIPGDIRWIENNRKSNSGDIKDLLQPASFFTHHTKIKTLSWEIDNSYIPVNKTIIHAKQMMFKINQEKYNLLLDLWSEHEKSADSFKKKSDKNRVERNVNYYKIIKQPKFLSEIEIYSIIV